MVYLILIHYVNSVINIYKSTVQSKSHFCNPKFFVNWWNPTKSSRLARTCRPTALPLLCRSALGGLPGWTQLGIAPLECPSDLRAKPTKLSKLTWKYGVSYSALYHSVYCMPWLFMWCDAVMLYELSVNKCNNINTVSYVWLHLTCIYSYSYFTILYYSVLQLY